jgi:hypothetical protein
MSFHLHHQPTFNPADPLGGGLLEEIEQEQNDPEAIVLQDEDSKTLAAFWERVEDDIHHDPDWSDFANE